jgi:hypothetical protein
MGFIEREGRAVTRSFRIDKALNDEIEAEAEKQGVSVSYVLESLVENYLNHYRWADRSGVVNLHPQTLNQLFDHLDEKTVSHIGFDSGSSVPRQGLLMRGAPINEESARQVLQILGEYDNWFTVSYHNADPPYFFIRNLHGEKWVIFIEAYLRGLYKNVLEKEVTCKRVGDNLQVIL